MLVAPIQPSPRFRLILEVRRVDGNDSLNVCLPVGSSQVMAVLDGFDGKTSGLGLINGRSADRNRTKSLGRRFSDDQFHTVVYDVSPTSVEVTIDGDPVTNWRGKDTELRLDGRFWKTEYPKQILLGSWATRFEFRRIELQPGNG